MAYNETPTRNWNKDGTTPATGVPALASLFYAEFDRIYANFVAIVNNGGAAPPASLKELFDAMPPVGSIIAWMPGYFTNGSNGGFTPVSISLTDNYIECTGALENDPDSLLYDGAGRYRPNLTDDRFLMGDVAGSCGGVGGNNSLAHTHAFTQPSAHAITYPNHKHRVGNKDATSMRFYDSAGNDDIRIQEAGVYGGGALVAASITAEVESLYTNESGGGSCSVTNNHSGGAVGAATITENRPLYLSCRYIQRKK